MSKKKRAEKTERANQILETVHRLVKGGRVRFGRLTRVDRRFIGKVVDVVWNVVGGNFSFVCMYKGRQYAHKEMLRAMLADYSRVLRPAKHLKLATKRKRALKDINISTDLEFEVHGVWQTLSSFFPVKVRQLKPVESAQWLHENRSVQERTKKIDEPLECPVPSHEQPENISESYICPQPPASQPEIAYFQKMTSDPPQKKRCVLSSASPAVPLHTTASRLAHSEFSELLSSTGYLQAYGDRCVASALDACS